ncbi:GDP-fucose transporter 1 isoform X2 [Scaptodrosophila lebanonensis]|uniref:GDP-fucose transporter 1 isoform X2 n=1 Tax=Drosophila lebanonensis TaxID=7225 RepID=A0A6J2TL15_DROLE|nr:GDP-fucose transporter 1 isoform X2 [Scaptodrosophila lebanonensis]
MYQNLEEHNRLVNRYLKIFFIVTLYWSTSILTVFVNKHLLSSESVNLGAPVFMSWFQCVVSAAICFAMSRCSRKYPSVFSFPNGDPLNIDTFRKILPLSLLFTLMVGANNLSLNVLLTWLILRQRTSFKCLLCCAAIVVGFWLGVDQESLTTVFSWRGTIFGILSSLALAMYSIQTKKSLSYVNEEVWLLSYYNNLYSIVLFLPLIILSGELETIITYPHLLAGWFWAAMILSGFCGFAIGFVTALEIKVTSPLTHNISGTAKACVQTVIATHYYNDARSALWWTSNVMVLVASAAYTRFKQLEMLRRHQQQSITTQKA